MSKSDDGEEKRRISLTIKIQKIPSISTIIRSINRITYHSITFVLNESNGKLTSN